MDERFFRIHVPVPAMIEMEVRLTIVQPVDHIGRPLGREYYEAACGRVDTDPLRWSAAPSNDSPQHAIAMAIAGAVDHETLSPPIVLMIRFEQTRHIQRGPSGPQ